ncbi:MAG: SRPBCC family protein [Gemmatimonadales bacterium]
MPTTQDLIAKSSVHIDAPPAKVWAALVTPAAIKQYMFGADVRSDWKVGSPITWSGEWQGKPYQDTGVIKQIQRERVLQYTHFSPLSGQPDRPENYHTVTIELSDGNAQTRVVLTQDNNLTEEARTHSEKNWNMMLGGLKKFVEGNK